MDAPPNDSLRVATMNDPKKASNASDVYQMVMQACQEQGMDAGQAAIIAKRVETLYEAARRKLG
jgi:hypothetical protein